MLHVNQTSLFVKLFHLYCNYAQDAATGIVVEGHLCCLDLRFFFYKSAFAADTAPAEGTPYCLLPGQSLMRMESDMKSDYPRIGLFLGLTLLAMFAVPL
jgi:hypothetical protein